MRRYPSSVNFIIFIAFFLSGMTGLVYQVLWTKYLANIFGSSIYAHTIVLTIFMGGLAFGNFLGGRFADRTKYNLFYIYGLLEIGMGIYCMLYPNFVSWIASIYQQIAWCLHLSHSYVLFFIQLVLNSLIIFVPTVMMGGTLPVMTKYITRYHAQLLKNISTLYFINSAGAVLGALICGFFFIRLLGLDTSIAIAAVVNLIIGLTCMSIAKSSPDPFSLEDQNTSRDQFSSSFISTSSQIKIILVAIGLSGFASMLYELMWIRTLIQFLGSSVYSFSLVVAAFIAGITLGSLWLSYNQNRLKNFYFVFGLVQACIFLTMYLSVLSIAQIPKLILKLQLMFNLAPFVYPFFLFFEFLCIFCILLLPTFFIGMTLPLASTLCSQHFRLLGREIGNVFSMNTLGALLGTMISGIFFLPLFGIYRSFYLGLMINLSLGAVILWTANARNARRLVYLLFIFFILFNFFLPLRSNPTLLLTGIFRYRGDPISFDEYYKAITKTREILFYKEGANVNVAVTQYLGELALMINGKTDASSHQDAATQLLSAHLPSLFHLHPESALVIGFGSGVTVGALTLHSSIKKIDCLEIAQEILDAGQYFRNYNYDCLHNKKVNFIVDDAKNYLSVNRIKYDVIISEPTNPWTAGTGSLMTLETFQRMKDSLNEHGIVLQWFHTYEMSDHLYKTIVATFLKVFPHASIWEPQKGDCFLIGSLEPLSIDPEKIQARINNEPSIKESLKRIYADNVYAFLSAQVLGEKRVHDLFYESAYPNKDRFPIIEFSAPMAFFLGNQVKILATEDMRIRPHPNEHLLIEDHMLSHPPSAKDILDIYSFFLNNRNVNIANRISWAWQEQLRPFIEEDNGDIFTFENNLISKRISKNLLEDEQNVKNQFPKFFDLTWKYLQDKISYHNSLRSIFMPANNEKEAIIAALKEAKDFFPEKKLTLGLAMAHFYRDDYSYPEAKQEYLSILAENNPSDEEEIQITQLAIFEAFDLASKEQDDIFLKALQEKMLKLSLKINRNF